MGKWIDRLQARTAHPPTGGTDETDETLATGVLSVLAVGAERGPANSSPAELGPDLSAVAWTEGDIDRFLARRYWPSAVFTPHWPSASQIITGLWQSQFGGRIDGVIGIDPLAMAEVLSVTGPAQLSGQTISAGNVAFGQPPMHRQHVQRRRDGVGVGQP